MRKELAHRTLSPEEIAMLSDIFRFILPEIKTQSDVDALAPGEMAIDYRRGEICIKSPYTGKPFYPNNAERLKLLGRKIVPGTTKFNADLVHGITFYTDLIELDKINEAFTPDSVIRQMHRPAVLFAKVAYDNYEGFGWPSASGTCLCIKSSEDAVIIKYYADKTNLEYIGQYNSEKHLFEGWSTANGSSDDYQVSTETGGVHASITIPGEIKDFTTIYVNVEEAILPGADISVNGTTPKPILGPDGKPLSTEITENTSIMLIYDNLKDAWVYVDRTETAIVMMMRLISERVADINRGTDDKTQNLIKKYQEMLNESENRMQNSMKSLREQHDREISVIKTAYDNQIEALTGKIKELEEQLTTLTKKVNTELVILPGADDEIVTE